MAAFFSRKLWELLRDVGSNIDVDVKDELFDVVPWLPRGLGSGCKLCGSVPRSQVLRGAARHGSIIAVKDELCDAVPALLSEHL